MSGDRVKLTIPPGLEAEMTPAVRAFVEVLLKRIDELESENRALRVRMKKLETRLNMAPRNSSLPPSSQHPHASPS